MFTNNIDPVALSIGPFQVRYYGIIFALGFVMTLFYLEHLRKKKSLDLSKDEVYDLLLYIIIGVVVGSRLGEVIFWEPSFYLSNPLKIFAVWEGGMSFHGGLIGSILAAWLYCKRHAMKGKITFLKLADAISVPAAFALALGRIGNFINGEIVGTQTTVSWCVKFSGTDGCRHPVQLYAFAGRFLTGLLLFRSSLKKHKDGLLFTLLVFLFGIGRFVTDFLRDDPRIFGLSTGQYLSLAMFVVAGYYLLTRYRDDLRSLLTARPGTSRQG